VTVKSWLRSSPGLVLSSLVFLLVISWTTAGLVAGVYEAVTGDFRGGRWTGVALVLHGALCGLIALLILLRRAHMWHLLAGLALTAPARSIDSWLIDPNPRWHLPTAQLLVVLLLAVKALSAVWRSRRAVPVEPAESDTDVDSPPGHAQ
jgi:hypothetical protein